MKSVADYQHKCSRLQVNRSVPFHGRWEA